MSRGFSYYSRGYVAGTLLGLGFGRWLSDGGFIAVIATVSVIGTALVVYDLWMTRRVRRELEKLSQVKWFEEHGNWPTLL
jgi:hypothetical protein